MKHFGNVCNIDGKSVEPVDIITFGAPCQDLSVAGRRSGLKHVALGDDETTRSGLFFEAIRIIKEMREATNGEYPKYAVYENVPGAFSSNKGWDFHAVLEALCSVCDSTVSIPAPYDKRSTDKLVWNGAGEIVGDNYSVAWRTLDAQYWGVPQRRKRIYLVADFTGRRAGEILFKPDSLRGYMPQGNEKGQGSTADAVGGIDGSVGTCGITLMDAYQHHGWRISENCGTLTAGQNDTVRGDTPLVVYSFDSLSSNSMKSSNPFSGCRAVEVAKCIDTTYPDPSKNQGGVAVVQAMATQQGGAEIAENLCPTITAAAGMSGNNQPVIALQANGIDRADTAGCNGAGWRENESYTLNTVDRHAVCYDARNHNVQDVSGTIQAKPNGGQSLNFINPVCYGIGNGQADNTTLWEEQVGTLNCMHDQQAVCYDARGNGDGETVPTLTGDHQNRITDYTAVAVQETKGEKECAHGTKTETNTHKILQALWEEVGAKKVAEWGFRILNSFQQKGVLQQSMYGERVSEGRNGFQKVDGSASNGSQEKTDGGLRGVWGEKCERCSPQGWEPSEQQLGEFTAHLQELSQQDSSAEGVLHHMWGADERAWLLRKALSEIQKAREPICNKNQSIQRRYIVRRLLPVECARLQGFPDDWGQLAPYDPADAEFWEDVRKTHAEINGKKYKPTKNLKKWYEGLHTDSAEYKMWGNGIALPNARYVLHGIAEQGAKTLGSLFDGSGGFPLAGAMNGITPLWASEVEPYPIAVTKSRFKEVHNETNSI